MQAANLQQQTQPADPHPLAAQPRADEAKVDCPICLESVPQSLMHPIAACMHSYCRECLEGHINSKVGDRTFPVPCPTPKCEAHVSLEECGVLVSDYATIKILLQVSACCLMRQSVCCRSPHMYLKAPLF